jgi:SSS family solute:Na+ symporter
MSLAEGYEFRFDKRTKVVMLIIVALVYTILFALQPVAAAGILAPMFGVDRGLMLAIVGTLFIIIAVTGGLKGLAWVNVIHSFVMYLGLFIVAVAAVTMIGGMEAVKIAAPSEYLSFFNPTIGIGTIIVWIIGTILSQMNSALMVNVTLGGKTLQVANRGMITASILLFPFALFPAIIGVVAYVAMPEIPANQAMYVLSESMSPWLGGLASMAVIAAIFSTAPALLLVVSTTLTQDLYKGFIKPNASPKQTMLFARVCIVVIGILAIYLGSKTSSIFTSMLGAFQIRSIAGIVLLFALFWPRVNARAGFWSILLGGSTAAVWFFTGNSFGMEPLIPAAVIGITTLLILTIMSKEPVSPGYSSYQELLKEYDAYEDDDVDSANVDDFVALTK